MPSPYDLAPLNGASFGELDASLLLTPGDGLTQSGGTFSIYPNGEGLALVDNWLGTLNNPDPSDPVSINTFIPASSTPQVIEYTVTKDDGSVSPAQGGIGAEVVAANSTGYLLEQLTGYIPGPHATITPDGNYFALTTVDLAVTDANGNFVGEGATPAELTFFVPEPSTVMLMPLMVAALMLTRLRAVRSFFGDR